MKKLWTTLMIATLVTVGCKDTKKSDESTMMGSVTGYDTDKNPETDAISRTDATSNIDIIPIEHASTILKWNDVVVYVDPVGGAEAFEGQEAPDLILVTDIHGDHFSAETLEALKTEDSKIIMPQAVADEMPEEFTPVIDVLNNGDSKERFGINVEAIPMYNLREEAKDFHTKGRGNGYVLNMGDQRVYFSGDTEDIPEMRGLKDIDVAFVCMNLPYTMPVKAAAEGVLAFAPKKVYPYHYRGKPDVSDVTEFKKLVNEGNKDIEVVQLDWYPSEEY